MHRRVVWSLIFLLFGVHLAKAEVQEDQAHKGIARQAHQDHQDGKEGMTIREDWCLEQERKKDSQGKDSTTYEGNSQGRTPVSKKETARVRTPRTLEEGSKGGKWKREKKWKRKKEKEKGKKVKHRRNLWWMKRKQQQHLVSLFVSERRRRCERKRQEEEQESREKQFPGKYGRWLFLLLVLLQHWFCVDAAAGRLEPKGKRKCRKSFSCRMRWKALP